MAEDNEAMKMIIAEYVNGTGLEYLNPEEMDREELVDMWKQIMDYGIKQGYLKQTEIREDGCTIKLTEKAYELLS